LFTPESGAGLDLLETDWREVPERQRSMRAVFDHSWRLLSEREKEVMQALSVFRGGCTRDAAQQIGGASLRELRALINWSLLEHTSSNRYQVHELLRQYGAEKLADQTRDVRDRHGDYCCAALKRWNTDLRGPRQAAAQEEMEHDMENIRAAWEWAAAQRAVALLDQGLDGLYAFLHMRSRGHDNMAACQLAIDAAGQVGERSPETADARRVIARALMHQAFICVYHLGCAAMARPLLDRAAKVLDGLSLAGCDARAERALLLKRMGTLAGLDLEQARRSLEQAASLFRALGDRYEEAWNLYDLGVLLVGHDEVNAALFTLEEGLVQHEALGNRFGIAISHMVLGDLTRGLGNYEVAMQHYRDGLAACRSGRIIHESWALCGMADIHRIRGDVDAARQLYEAGLSAARGSLAYEFTALIGLGALSPDSYAAEDAEQRFQRALAFAQRHNYPWGVACALAALGNLASFQGDFAASADYLRQSVGMVRQDARWNLAAIGLCDLGRTYWLFCPTAAPATRHLRDPGGNRQVRYKGARGRVVRPGGKPSVHRQGPVV
jgi:tetratricopeptide (TPR) repeat protein